MKIELSKIRKGHNKPDKQTEKCYNIDKFYDSSKNIIDLLVDFTTIVNESR